MLTRREFLNWGGAFGALSLVGPCTTRPAEMVARWKAPGSVEKVTRWDAPGSVDNTGTQNVSAALTNWLSHTGRPGDVFRLRRRPNGAPGRYWVPQGVRIGKSMVLDLDGCELFTGTTLGADDPDFEANRTAFPALWDDWDEQSNADFQYEETGRTWPRHRTVVLVAASDVRVTSARPGARIQGAARTVQYRSPDVIGRRAPTGCIHDVTLEGQHGIRIGGRPGDYSEANSYNDIVLDLTDISVEFVHGDGIYLGDNHHDIKVLGRNLGEAVLSGTPFYEGIQGHTGQGGEIMEGGSIRRDRWKPDAVALPGIHHTGRHGIATDFRNYGLVVDGVAIWRVGYSIIDFEPSSPGAEIVRPTVRNIETGIHYLLWIPAVGPRPVRDLVIENTVNYEHMTMDTRSPNASHRHSNWVLRNNRVKSDIAADWDGTVLKLDRIDGLQVVDNSFPVSGSAQALATYSSTDVVVDPVENIQFPRTR